jgi:hypothetical protein
MKILIPAARAILLVALVNLGLGDARGQSTNPCASSLNSDDYSKYTIVLGAIYKQTNASGAIPVSSNYFGFAAVIKLSTNLTAASATVTIPGKTAQPMQEVNSRDFNLDVGTNSFANLSAAFPSGAYVFATANQTVSVNLPPVSAMQNAPSLSNYAAAQAINPTEDFTLNWTAFSGGGAGDEITVDVIDTSTGVDVYPSPKYGCPDALDGTATSFLIPANTLTTNQTYQVSLLFVKVLTLDTNSIPGVALLAGTETGTQTFIATGGGSVGPPPTAPILTNAAWLAGGSLRFDLITTPGVTYTVQFNNDLSNPAGWTPLLTTNAVGNAVAFTNRPPGGAQAGFYRAFHN